MVAAGNRNCHRAYLPSTVLYWSVPRQPESSAAERVGAVRIDRQLLSGGNGRRGIENRPGVELRLHFARLTVFPRTIRLWIGLNRILAMYRSYMATGPISRLEVCCTAILGSVEEGRVAR